MLVLIALLNGCLLFLLIYPWSDPMAFQRRVRWLAEPEQSTGPRWTERLLANLRLQPNPAADWMRDHALIGATTPVADLYLYRLLGLAGGLLLGLISLTTGQKLVGGLLLICSIGAWSLPTSRLKAGAREVRSEINRRLPAFLQALAMMTEAGMNLQPACQAFAERERSALGNQLALALEQAALGAPLSQALMAMAERCDVDDLHRVVAALIQAAERGGAGLAETCRTLASEAWLKRRDAARELAQQASTRMFLPLFLLVLPTLFLFMMGPSLISLIRNF